MTAFETWSLILSWLAAAASAYFAFRAKRSKDEANATSKRLLAIEEERELDRKTETLKARLVADIGELDPKTHVFRTLTVTNLGPADATNVQIDVKSLPYENGAWERASASEIVRGNTRTEFLAAGAKTRLKLLWVDGSLGVEVQLSWVDGLGPHKPPVQTLQ